MPKHSKYKVCNKPTNILTSSFLLQTNLKKKKDNAERPPISDTENKSKRSHSGEKRTQKGSDDGLPHMNPLSSIIYYLPLKYLII